MRVIVAFALMTIGMGREVTTECTEGDCSSEDSSMLQVNAQQSDPWTWWKGGVHHGLYEADFDWAELAKITKPDCSRVCRKMDNSYCYPLGHSVVPKHGPPCGVLQPGPNRSYGCFFNAPTSTCALCTTEQKYCCPFD